MKFTDEHKHNLSLAAKARCNDAWRLNQSESKRTQIDDKKLVELYESGMTQIEVAESLGVGRKVVANAMQRLGIKARVAKKRNQWGENNDGWKGGDAGLSAKHRRLHRAFGQPSKCDVCGTVDKSKSYDWANLTGDYDNPADFKRMCRSCHWKYDDKYLNFKGAKGGKGKCGTRVIDK